MTMNIAQPYVNLTPDTILDAIDSLGLRTDGRILALNSYENRVYQIGIEDEKPIVAKFYRPERWTDDAIDEEHQFLHALVSEEIPVVAPIAINGTTLHQHMGYRYTIFPKHGGRSPDLDQPGVLARIGRFIGRIHAVGQQSPFVARPTIDISTFAMEPSQYLLAHQFIPQDLLPAYTTLMEQAIDGVQRCFDRAGDVNYLRLHGDCHMGNVLWTDDGPHFVDFDDSRMGPAIQDLWMMLSGSELQMRQQLQALLSGYECFVDFDDNELHLIEAMRTLRLIHYSAWLARRWDDPAFKQTFTWFNTQHYWQDRILELREQIAAMDEPIQLSVGGNF